MGEEREKGWNYREFSRAASRVRQNPEQNCRERFKASLAPYFRPTFERISRVHTLFRPVCVCMCVYALLVRRVFESVRPVDYDKC